MTNLGAHARELRVGFSVCLYFCLSVCLSVRPSVRLLLL